MLRKLSTNGRHVWFSSVSALFLGVIGVLAILTPLEHTYAYDGIPVPSKKPFLSAEQPGEQLAEQSQSVQGEVVEYSLKDFAKALLDYGQPPIPKFKPVLASATDPIRPEDAQVYKEIFKLQAQGKIDQAEDKMAGLRDKRLRGHVLYQRYMHPTAYISSFDELRSWLDLYADYPGADKIYKLAQRKKPADFTGTLKEPVKLSGIAQRSEPMMVPGRVYKSSKKRSAAQKEAVAKLNKSIYRLIRQTRPTQAMETLKESETTALLDKVEYDILRALIAKGYLHAGKPDEALELAKASAKRSGIHVPIAGWIAGLVSWANGDYRAAAQYFEITARSPYASGWTAAGGAYWAARSHMQAGHKSEGKKWLARATDNPRTFYGLIATRALGRDFDFNWEYPTFTEDDYALLRDTKAGARAMDLVAAGQTHLAEAELLRFKPETPEMSAALLSYAGYAGLPALSLRLGSAYETSSGLSLDAALYPKGGWKFKEDYKVDPALVHAIMRQESRFDHRAESRSGARGLMQLMPSTAEHVAGRKNINEELLIDPVYNLELGEKYLAELLSLKTVDGDLLSVLVAYNAGPGNLSRWKKQWASVQDPLLFIELMPSSETRAYVERVLSNYWIYRMRDGEKTPTLNALADGKAARYADSRDAPAQDDLSAPFRIAYNK
ncbi:MAG: lytic transglycosylase domain-containing protein [Alphaproteobacteria bacterium]|nr:lytic transglycosylase domain-containing protein [Alphaproteobacteria bacterium]